MRWIQHTPDGKITRGVGQPPETGDYFIITQVGSAAVKGGVLHVNGARADKGAYKFAMKDGSLVEFDVPKKGAKAVRRGGGQRG